MAVNQEIQHIADTIRQAVPAERIYLFGSHAYGTPHDGSDYDFFLVIPDGLMRPIEARQRAKRSLIPLRLGVPVDVLAATNSSFYDMRDTINSVEKEVAQKGVLLFDRSGMGATVA
ncbi:MAG: nucleotidyltransferase domain-containing protein [Oscillospiraceae bacterium]|nr:nucleotidyltransferase domain-containing protein [Oscillospiraceae bacterium]